MKPDLKMIVEIPMGSNLKYEKVNGKWMVSRETPIRYPFNYGYINELINPDDGENVDVILLSNYSYERGSILPIIPIGYLEIKYKDIYEYERKLLVVHKHSVKTCINKDKINKIKKFFKEYKVERLPEDTKVIIYSLTEEETKKFLWSLQNEKIN